MNIVKKKRLVHITEIFVVNDLFVCFVYMNYDVYIIIFFFLAILQVLWAWPWGYENEAEGESA